MFTINDFSMDYQLERDLYAHNPEYYARAVYGCLYHLNYSLPEEPAKQAIGQFKAYVLDLEEAEKTGEYAAFDLFDLSSHTASYFDALFSDISRFDIRTWIRKKFTLDSIASLLILHQVHIQQPFSSHSLALAVASQIIRDWGRGCDLMITKPSSLHLVADQDEMNIGHTITQEQTTSSEQQRRQVVPEAKKLGFVQVGKTDVWAMNYAMFSPYLLQ